MGIQNALLWLGNLYLREALRGGPEPPGVELFEVLKQSSVLMAAALRDALETPGLCGLSMEMEVSIIDHSPS